jgi:hypothetical protein
MVMDHLYVQKCSMVYKRMILIIMNRMIRKSNCGYRLLAGVVYCHWIEINRLIMCVIKGMDDHVVEDRGFTSHKSKEHSCLLYGIS